MGGVKPAARRGASYDDWYIGQRQQLVPLTFDLFPVRVTIDEWCVQHRVFPES